MPLEFDLLTCDIDNPNNLILIDVAELSQRDQRIVLLSLLYAVDSSDYETSVESVIDMMRRGFCLTLDQADAVYVAARAIVENRDTLDNQLKPLLTNWRFERLGVCTRLILRIAFWELASMKLAPIIVINEAIELAKLFTEKDAYKFINGILDEAMKRSAVVADTAL